MALTVGTHLGSHEITGLLGKGGMGEVYRARDLKLNREVAIKILPEEFSGDADRVNRFQREAQVLASLNHPNIAQIYGLEDSTAQTCIVMELVEGETLAERLRRGRIPLDEALPIAKQIAEALEAAHEKGVIHRDLKPANIKVTPDRKVKVLDFGLAKAFQGQQTSLSNSPTLMSASVPGMILGTAAYMSPEQAKGIEANRASDTGEQILFTSTRSSPMSVFSKSATGAGAEQLLLKSVTGIWDWSRDGKFVLYTVDGREITAVSLVGDKTPFVYLPKSNFFQSQARFSPDARFVAYASTESGRVEVYVRSFPNPSSKWQISTAGGSSPRWRKDGQELFYVAADQKLTAVPIRTAAGGLDIGQPVPLFENRVELGRYGGLLRQQYDVTEDGQQFIVNTVIEQSGESPITVVVNWTASMKK
jgi:serine/threonine protein kinase